MKIADLISTDNVRTTMFDECPTIDFRDVTRRLQNSRMETGVLRMECKLSVVTDKIPCHEEFIGIFPKGIIRFRIHTIQRKGIGSWIYYSHNRQFCFIFTLD